MMPEAKAFLLGECRRGAEQPTSGIRRFEFIKDMVLCVDEWTAENKVCTLEISPLPLSLASHAHHMWGAIVLFLSCSKVHQAVFYLPPLIRFPLLVPSCSYLSLNS